MASNLYDILYKTNQSRKSLISKANSKGYNLPDNTSLQALSELIDIPEYSADTTDAVYQPRWVRPEYWPDLIALLDEGERNGMTPRMVLLLDTVEDETTICKSNATTSTGSASTATLNGDGYLTSDGVWYDASTSADIKHTWDDTKDITIDGKTYYRYIVVYKTTDTPFNYIAITNASDCNALELIIGDVTCNSNYGFGIYNVRKLQCIRSNTNHMVESLKVSMIASIHELYYAEMNNIRNVVFSDYRPPVSTAYNGRHLLSSCNSLETIIMDNLVTITNTTSHSYGGSYAVFYNAYATYISAEKLESITGPDSSKNLNFLNSASNPIRKMYINLPSLKSLSWLYYCYLHSGYINMDSLETITDSVLYVYTRDQLLRFPSLKEFKKANKASSVLHIYGSNTYLMCDQLEKIDTLYLNNPKCAVYMPNLTEANVIGCYSGNTITDPDTSTSLPAGYWFRSHLMLPALRKVNSLFSYYSATNIIDTPVLEEISTAYLGDSMLDYLVLPPLLKNIPEKFLIRNYYLKYLEIPEDFMVSGLNLTECTKLNRQCLRDIITRLADVTVDPSNTYTITFGATNKAKLSEEEWQPAIDKGWVID